jgi:hypothetical protein
MIRVLKKKIRSIFKRFGFKTEIQFIKSLERYSYYDINQIDPNDIVIAGYPKSGNTWMQHIVTGLLLGMNSSYLNDRIAAELVPDVQYKKFYKRFFNQMVFKSHLNPKPEYRKVIHLVRNPVNVIVSYFHYNKNLGLDITLEDMVLRGEGIENTWHNHTKLWLENKFDAQILVVKYEDLHNDLIKECNRICAFLGINRSNEDILNAIKGVDFKSMSDKEQRTGWDNKGWDVTKKFLRQGNNNIDKTQIRSDLIQHIISSNVKLLEKLNYSNEIY